MAKAHHYIIGTIISGFCIYFHSFNREYSKLAELLYLLTYKGISFIWGELSQAAF